MHQAVEEMAKPIAKHHKEVLEHLEVAAATYKQQANLHRHPTSVEVGDVAMVHLRKSRLPSEVHGYKIDLPSHFNIHSTFNISDELFFKVERIDCRMTLFSSVYF